MVGQLAGLPGCRFVSVADVVGDAWLTLRAYWEEYASLVWRWQLPPARQPPVRPGRHAGRHTPRTAAVIEWNDCLTVATEGWGERT
jgi:hypothetical protein